MIGRIKGFNHREHGGHREKQEVIITFLCTIKNESLYQEIYKIAEKGGSFGFLNAPEEDICSDNDLKGKCRKRFIGGEIAKVSNSILQELDKRLSALTKGYKRTKQTHRTQRFYVWNYGTFKVEMTTPFLFLLFQSF